MCVSLLAALSACCSPSFPAPPPLSLSLASDLVKCSRTAAWRVLVQLINNSDNMIYVVHSAHKITVCNCFPNVFCACFFLSFSASATTKKKGGEEKGLGPRKQWVHYPAECTPQWLELTGILGCDPTVVNFHLSLFMFPHMVQTLHVCTAVYWLFRPQTLQSPNCANERKKIKIQMTCRSIK